MNRQTVSDRGDRRPRRAQDGFSLLELLIVTAVMGVMMAVSLVAFQPAKRSFLPEEAAVQVMRFLREANGRALAERQSMRVEINPNDPSWGAIPTISIVDEGVGTDPLDDRRIRKEPMVSLGAVGMDKPNGMNDPPAPFTFLNVSLTASSAPWSIRFTPEGTAVGVSSDTPTSAALWFYPRRAGYNVDATSVRAITIFGPSASVRLWKNRLVGGQMKFVSEGR